MKMQIREDNNSMADALPRYDSERQKLRVERPDVTEVRENMREAFFALFLTFLIVALSNLIQGHCYNDKNRRGGAIHPQGHLEA